MNPLGIHNTIENVILVKQVWLRKCIYFLQAKGKKEVIKKRLLRNVPLRNVRNRPNIKMSSCIGGNRMLIPLESVQVIEKCNKQFTPHFIGAENERRQ